MIDLDSVRPLEQMTGEDEEETAELEAMQQCAERYLQSFDWCAEILDRRFGFAVAGVVGTFLFRVRIKDLALDWLWVIEGDVPSAYFVSDRAPNPKAALEVYCELMEEWVQAVRSGEPLDDVFPVEAPTDRKHADMLSDRISALRTDIIPHV